MLNSKDFVCRGATTIQEFHSNDIKNIPGFENYQATPDGRVWSKPRKDALGHNRVGHWMKPSISSGGYYIITLHKKTRTIHRLMLETYVGPCPDGMECCHINGNKICNHIYNLRWGSKSENAKDSVRHGTHVDNKGEKHGKSKLTEKEVKLIISIYDSSIYNRHELASYFNVNEATIRDIIKRRTWNYLWE